MLVRGEEGGIIVDSKVRECDFRTVGSKLNIPLTIFSLSSLFSKK